MQSKLNILWDLTRGQRSRYAIALLSLIAGAATLYVWPIIVGRTIDGIVGQSSFLSRHLVIAGGLVVLTTALSGLLMYFKSRYAAIASENIARDLRDRLYDHLQKLPCQYHDKAQTGDLVQRCTSDVETVRQFYSNQVVEVARASVLLLGAIPAMLWLDWTMCLIALAVLPVITVFAVVFFKKVQGSFKELDEAEGAMTTVLQENLTGIRVVRAFARQDFERSKFAVRNTAHWTLNYRLYRIMAYYWACSDFMCFMQISLVLLLGANRVLTGRLEVGTLVAFLAITNIYIWPVRQMGRIVTEMGKAMVSLTRIREVLTEAEESSPAVATEVSTPIQGRIVFDAVRFAHRETTVLDGVSFTVEPGQTLAILGPSGSGKSTIVHLLLRLYDYTGGSITLDGLELSTLDRKFARSQFGVVMQEPFLYSKTLRDNIRIARHSASDDEIHEVARMSDIHDSIEKFEKQYDTMVGERGVTLSGGQRQRVAIARALVRSAPVLLLDDALSAVDTETETMILDALRTRRGKQTTLLIAHRLSTLMHADKVIVLEKGRVVQTGTHESLVREPGLYRRLWEIQTALQDDLREELNESPQLTEQAAR